MKVFLLVLCGPALFIRRNVCIGLGIKFQLMIKNITATKHLLDLVLLVAFQSPKQEIWDEHLELPFTNTVPSFKPCCKTEVEHYDSAVIGMRNLRLREVPTYEGSYYQEVDIKPSLLSTDPSPSLAAHPYKAHINKADALTNQEA